jgi:exodeoxyribonuclease VII large subunit
MLDTPRTVREVTDHIRDLFDSDRWLADIWITGEVLESTTSRSGHVFFTMADDGAQMRCVLFRMNALRQRTLPSSGSVCVAHGRVEVYAPDGTYQFYVDLVEDAGIGLAALELELLRQQLEAEGLFAEARKRPLPLNPTVIGVVTSESGAVWHDIQQVIRRRFPFVQLLLAPSAVQGDSAPGTLLDSLQSLILDGRADVIVIARGGGSASDLAAFNDENLVRAVFASPIPVVSAIGHETDWTLLDFVADQRAPTPSAAAELMTPSIAERLDALSKTLDLQASRFERSIASSILDIDRLSTALDRLGPRNRLLAERARHATMQQDLVDHAVESTGSRQKRREALVERLLITNRDASTRRQEHFSHASALLEALSPAKTMARGYAFIEHRDSGRTIRSASQVSTGDALRTRLLDGTIESTVTGVIAPTT